MTVVRIILFCFLVALSGCWHAEDQIYGEDDYFLPLKGQLMSLSDDHGPLGLYSISDQNQYNSVYREAETNSPEHTFRVFSMGFVPIDRMATYKEPHKDWLANRTFSKSIFEDGETRLFILTLEHEDDSGQLIFASFVKGDVLGICSNLLQEGKGLHKEFLEFASMREPAQSLTRKAGIAVLVLNEVSQAKNLNELSCEEYKIAVHQERDKSRLIESVRKADELRKAEKQREVEEMSALARAVAEERIASKAQKSGAASSQTAPDKTDLSLTEQLAKSRQERAELYREAYDINVLIDRERWGTLDGVGGKYFGVDRHFRDRGLLFKSKMLCHNLSGYQSIYVTVTHASSPATNAGWVMRSGNVPIRIETERGSMTHLASLEVIGDTQYTNTVRITFADMTPEKLDNKYVQDPALLERTRRQAKLFGSSVEALTRMGINFLSLEDAMESKTLRLYADIRQNGAVRTVMLGDFGLESNDKGLAGFHAACLFDQ